jgi:putative PIN family toxin of toxin-antitoxin system
MLVVVDTSVLFQSLYSTQGASHFILSLVRLQKIKLAVSLKVFAEYEEVLKRKKSLGLSGLSMEDIENILTFLAYIGRPFDTHFLFRPNLRDESDNIFVELAVASGAKFAITNNIRDFSDNPQLRFPDFQIVTPSEFVKSWRKENEK